METSLEHHTPSGKLEEQAGDSTDVTTDSVLSLDMHKYIL